jgi:hypothetical protein
MFSDIKIPRFKVETSGVIDIVVVTMMKVLGVSTGLLALLSGSEAFTPSGSKLISPLNDVLCRTSSLNAAPPTEKDLEYFQSYGEASRKFRRSYFSHSDWLKARADDRFFYNLSSIVKSGIIRQLVKRTYRCWIDCSLCRRLERSTRWRL